MMGRVVDDAATGGDATGAGFCAVGMVGVAGMGAMGEVGSAAGSPIAVAAADVGVVDAIVASSFAGSVTAQPAMNSVSVSAAAILRGLACRIVCRICARFKILVIVHHHFMFVMSGCAFTKSTAANFENGGGAFVRHWGQLARERRWLVPVFAAFAVAAHLRLVAGLDSE